MKSNPVEWNREEIISERMPLRTVEWMSSSESTPPLQLRNVGCIDIPGKYAQNGVVVWFRFDHDWWRCAERLSAKQTRTLCCTLPSFNAVPVKPIRHIVITTTNYIEFPPSENRVFVAKVFGVRANKFNPKTLCASSRRFYCTPNNALIYGTEVRKNCQIVITDRPLIGLGTITFELKLILISLSIFQPIIDLQIL